MLLTGQSITAEGTQKNFFLIILEALRAGLLSKMINSETETRHEAIRVAEDILKMSRSVMALGKAFFYTQIEQHTINAYR